MWWRSPSFILENKQQERDRAEDIKSTLSAEKMVTAAAAAVQNPNSNSNISAYYQTRAAHHGVVTSDWLEQAQDAVGEREGSDDGGEEGAGLGGKKVFNVIDEFNNWRKQPDLAEAVAAIRALAAVIRSIEASTMMELEVELKKASDCLK
ncbi:unnamed protein product [Rhodiola kirilowii]